MFARKKTCLPAGALVSQRRPSWTLAEEGRPSWTLPVLLRPTWTLALVRRPSWTLAMVDHAQVDEGSIPAASTPVVTCFVICAVGRNHERSSQWLTPTGGSAFCRRVVPRQVTVTRC
jgi:hypothetical protein